MLGAGVRSESKIHQTGVAVLRLKSFGGLALERDGQVVSGGASRRRPLAFLILLAAARERAGAPGAGGMTRDKLASYLWRDSDADSARHALAQTLYSMRRELDPEAVVTTGNDLSLNPAVVSTDLWEFDAALAKGQCQEAIALYSGPFLDGFYVSEAPEFERWAEEQRGYFAQRYRGALEALAAEAEARKDLRAAADWRRRLVTADPLDSRLALLYMKALAGIGDRAAAIRHAHVHETLLKQELRLQPDAELRAFTRALRETEPESAAASAPAAVAAASAVRAEASASFTPTTPEPSESRISEARSWK